MTAVLPALLLFQQGTPDQLIEELHFVENSVEWKKTLSFLAEESGEVSFWRPCRRQRHPPGSDPC